MQVSDQENLGWNSALATGVEWLDSQHKELFKRFDRLLFAMSNGDGVAEVVGMLNFLDEYVVVHFEAEEQAMHLYKYPHAIEHISAHAEFIDRVGAIRNRLSSGAVLNIADITRKNLVDWFVNHISIVDKALGAYIAKGLAKK